MSAEFWETAFVDGKTTYENMYHVTFDGPVIPQSVTDPSLAKVSRELANIC